MKKVMCFLLLLISYNLFATDYYVSNQGNDNNDGKSINSAWATLAKVNLEMPSFRSGDNVYFENGGEFYGSLSVIEIDGVTFSNYGSDIKKPILKGSKSISNWTNEGGNIWSISTGLDEVYQVYKDDNPLSNASLPKQHIEYGFSNNYLKVAKGSGSTFTCEALKGHSDIVGASIHILGLPWVLSTKKVTSFNSSTGQVTLSEEVKGGIKTGTEFIINNHYNLLSRQDQWFFNQKNTLFIYSLNEPKNITINTLNKSGIYSYRSDFINIENLIIKNYNLNGIESESCVSIKISDVDIIHCNKTGIRIFSEDYKRNYASNIINNTIKGGDAGISCLVPNGTISNNVLSDIGLLKNMTPNGFNDCQGMKIYSNNAVVSRNILKNIGYVPINFAGSKVLIEKNYINGYCLTKHDGGSIYTWNDSYSSKGAEYSIIDKNTIISTVETGHWSVQGIYMDDRVHDVTITNNNISGGKNGLYLHNTKNITLTGNKVYESSDTNLLLREDKYGGAGQMVNNVITNNQYFNSNSNQNARFSVEEGSYKALATFNNNIYYSASDLRCISTFESGTLEFLTLSEWQSIDGQDLNSETNSSLWSNDEDSLFEYNTKDIPKSISLPSGDWYDLEGNHHIGDVTLAPYSSIILVTSDKNKKKILMLQLGKINQFAWEVTLL